MTERCRPRRPGFAPVLWGSLALFAVLFSLLTYQLSAAAQTTQRPVQVRKVIKRRVVTTVVPAQGSSEAGEAPATTTEAPEVTEAPEASSAPVVTSAS